MNRWVALLLAIVGGAAAALAVVMFGTAMIAGVLWLFVFGDDPWPGWLDPVANLALPIVGLALWAGFGAVLWRTLKRI